MAFVTSAERIGLVLTCLVSMFFFLKVVAERTPPSDTVPLLSIYYVMLSFEVRTFYIHANLSVWTTPLIQIHRDVRIREVSILERCLYQRDVRIREMFVLEGCLY